MAALGLCCCAWAPSSCGEWGPLLATMPGPLTVVASPVSEHGLQSAGSVAVAYGLNSCGSQAPERRLSSCSAQAQLLLACGILPDQGSNPCPLHWQVDSQPLRHKGSPICLFFAFISFALEDQSKKKKNTATIYIKECSAYIFL